MTKMTRRSQILREAASALERVAEVREWREHVAGDEEFGVQVFWTRGKEIDGYAHICGAVQRKIEARIGALIDEAIHDMVVETDRVLADAGLPRLGEVA